MFFLGRNLYTKKTTKTLTNLERLLKTKKTKIPDHFSKKLFFSALTGGEVLLHFVRYEGRTAVSER